MNQIARVMHPALPEGMTLSDVIELVERLARHLGLGAARRAVWLRMMRQTAPADWCDPHCDAARFRAQQDLARDLGISEALLPNSPIYRIHQANPVG